jgi:hypothetical protein
MPGLEDSAPVRRRKWCVGSSFVLGL